jgi:Ser/Thr protein kinase RdoA (MazF antagonist)
MALLTPLALDEARALLAAWDLSLETLVPLPSKGTVNSNFRLQASGRTWFLRINEGKRDADVAAEAELVTQLRQGGLPTPEVMRTRRDGWFATHAGKPVTMLRPAARGRGAPGRCCTARAHRCRWRRCRATTTPSTSWSGGSIASPGMRASPRWCRSCATSSRAPAAPATCRRG